MNESVLKFSGLKAFFRLIGFALMGFVAFSKPAKDVDLLNALFSALTGLFFGSVYRAFLVWFTKPFNRELKEKYGKKAVKKALDNGLVYIFPFAVIVFISRFFFGASLIVPLFSSALLIGAISGASSVNALREKPSAANNVVAFIVSSVFTTLWIYYSPWLARVPIYAESGLKLLQVLLKNFVSI